LQQLENIISTFMAWQYKLYFKCYFFGN